MSHIRSDAEYRQSVRQLAAARKIEAQQRSDLAAMELSQDQIEGVLQPGRVFHEQLQADIAWYERARRREFSSVAGFDELGPFLIALRIGKGWTQRDLARRLGTSDASVSRDEKNEYFGISVERAQRILDALEVSVNIQVDRETHQHRLDAASYVTMENVWKSWLEPILPQTTRTEPSTSLRVTNVGDSVDITRILPEAAA
ncbi:MAG: helix-turn-helix domain-containing protein [Candidatus Dormibacteraceae bacterium]